MRTRQKARPTASARLCRPCSPAPSPTTSCP